MNLLDEHRIGALIVTYNPNIERFKNVLKSIINKFSIIVIVDNGSKNQNELIELCDQFQNITVIKMERNYGLAFGLNQGIEFMLKQDLDWVMTLDQDSIILFDSWSIIPEEYLNKENIGIININGNPDKDYDKMKLLYPIISGSIININVFKSGIRYREEFFADQVDFDYEVQARGFKIKFLKNKYLDHELGKINPIKKIRYEPPWRIYLIIRNSTKLYEEKKIKFSIWALQISQNSLEFLRGCEIDSLKKLKILTLIYFYAIKDYLSNNFNNDNVEKKFDKLIRGEKS